MEALPKRDRRTALRLEGHIGELHARGQFIGDLVTIGNVETAIDIADEDLSVDEERLHQLLNELCAVLVRVRSVVPQVVLSTVDFFVVQECPELTVRHHCGDHVGRGLDRESGQLEGQVL